MSDESPAKARPAKARRRVWSLLPALGGAASYVVLYLVLQPWLNESSDLAFYCSVAALTLVLVFTAFALVRAIFTPRSPRQKSRPPWSTDDDDDRAGPSDSNVIH
jgi:hypothetical protein